MPVTARDAAQDVLDRARRLLALDVASTAPLIREDLRRTAHAIGVAALDTYFHWLIRGVELDGNLPRELAKLEINFGDLVETSRKSVVARREDRDDRPMVRARHVLNETLLTLTFQSPKMIESGSRMIGVTDCWGKTSRAMVPALAPKDLKDRLNSVIRRRNLIVHEGDLARLVRPQRINRNPLKRVEVDADLDWLEAFISAYESIR